MRPPKEGYRAAFPAEFRLVDGSAEGQENGDGRTLTGHFAVFNQWAEINSNFEGHFLERISPSAFNKTFKENRSNMRVLFQHGKDPTIGDKPLGPIKTLRADSTGAYYEVPLLETSYNADLIPGLRSGLFGSSFRFTAVKEDFVDRPKRSTYNPNRLPERTITEARVLEFGPVTFPAYSGASASLRSLSDEMMPSRVIDRPDGRGREVVPAVNSDPEPDWKLPMPDWFLERRN